MIKAKINGKKVEIETSWEEVTWGKFLQLIEKPNDYIHVLSVFLNEPYDYIKKAKIEGLEPVISRMGFAIKEPEILEQPTNLGGYSLPKDLSIESVDQFEFMRNSINANLKNIQTASVREKSEIIGLCAAIYIQPQWFANEFNEDQAHIVAAKLYEYPCVEVMSVGSFFYAKCMSTVSGKKMSTLRQHIQMKKSRRGFVILMRRLGSMLRLT